jgi:hypothetical protein
MAILVVSERKYFLRLVLSGELDRLGSGIISAAPMGCPAEATSSTGVYTQIKACAR